MIDRRHFILGTGASLLVPALAPEAFASTEQFLSFFTGKIAGSGTLHDFKKGETKQVRASIAGRKSGDGLRLSQDFEFSDGRSERKVWTFVQRGGSIVGKRSDLRDPVNVALSGNRASLAYTARTPVDGSTYNLSFNEQIEFVSSDRVESVTSIKWTFLSVGEIRLSLRKI